MREQRPSAAATFLRCLGQPALIESLNLPPTTSDYAVEGSAAHLLAEKCLREDSEPMDHVATFLDVEVEDEDGTRIERVLVTSDMCEPVEKYLEVVRREAHGNVLLVEKKIDCSQVLGHDPETGEPRTGTGDAVIIPRSSAKPLQIHDYKHGRGVEVHAERNFQEMIYGGGFLLSNLEKLPHKRIQLWIHQPRIKFEPDMWEISREELLDWCAKTLKRSKVIDTIPIEDVERYLKAGEKQCRWCEAAKAGKCPAIDAEVAAAFDNIDEENMAVIPPEDLEELAERLTKLPLLQMYIDATRAEGFQTLNAGQAVPGWKLVAGKRGARAWSDAEKAEDRIKRMRVKKEDMYNMGLRSPTQLEKVLSEKRYQALVDEGFITQPDGKPIMVPADDPREGITHENQFDNLEDQ